MEVVHRADLVPRALADRRGARSPRAAGFSLVEVLVAGVLLLVILLGILPLFIRSTINRHSGRESTAVSSFARSRAEALLQLPFEHQDVSVPPGSTELEIEEYLVQGSDTWSTDDSDASQAVWIRTTRIQQFRSADLLDGDTDGDGNALDTPMDGGADPRSVQLKQIEVEVTSPREGGMLTAGEELTVRVLKAF